MLASAGIPGAFPFRIIDGQLYVDGGVTGNIIYGGRIAEEDSLPAQWQKTYPNLLIPKFRYWVIFNNQFRPVPKWLRRRTGRRSFNAALRHPRERLRRPRCAISSR